MNDRPLLFCQEARGVRIIVNEEVGAGSDDDGRESFLVAKDVSVEFQPRRSPINTALTKMKIQRQPFAHTIPRMKLIPYGDIAIRTPVMHFCS